MLFAVAALHDADDAFPCAAAEFDRDDTVAAIELALRSLGHRTERIGHARQLEAALGGSTAALVAATRCASTTP